MTEKKIVDRPACIVHNYGLSRSIVYRYIELKAIK